MSFGEFITAPQVWPFSVALGLFFAVTLFEIVMAWTGVGGDFGLDLDPDLPVGTPATGLFGHFLDWLELGRVPFLVSVAVFLLCFGLLGMFAQNLQLQLVGHALPWPIVALGCTLVSLPVVRISNRMIGRIWPKDVESSAVSHDSLVGHEAVVVLGTVSTTNPGQVRVRDPNGTTHHLLAFSDAEGETYSTGEHVLIVARRGASFAVIRHPNPSSSSR